MSLVLISRVDSIAVLELNRPKALNALSAALIGELKDALKACDSDPEVGAIVLRGSERVFCAGADIKELRNLTFVKAYLDNFLQDLGNQFAATTKPVIAAVNGYALGGGCELAMMCDIIYAGDKAVFGQPEVKIGTIPGAGGTQRLIRAIGKAKAMDMILTGEPISAKEAEAAGLVAKVFPVDKLVEEAVNTAKRIASFSPPVIAMAKEAVNQAEQLSLADGLRFESRLYHATFGLEDQKEGMDAFLAKRQADWKGA